MAINILAFDTTCGVTSVAIGSQNQILATAYNYSPHQQAETLVPMIEQCLNKANMDYKNLDYLNVTTGPGSFTGIRIGLSVAQSIILGAPHIKSISFTNFEIAYHQAIVQVKDYEYMVICLDAFREELYIQIFDKSGQTISKPSLIKIIELENYINNLKGNIIIAGSGIKRIYNNTSQAFMIPRFPYPNARKMITLTAQKIKNNNYNSNLEPLYIRNPDVK